MMFNEDEVSMLSPKEKWRRKHDLHTVKGLDGYSVRGNDRRMVVGFGDTEDDALIDWAVKSMKGDWK